MILNVSNRALLGIRANVFRAKGRMEKKRQTESSDRDDSNVHDQESNQKANAEGFPQPFNHKGKEKIERNFWQTVRTNAPSAVPVNQNNKSK